MEKLKVLIIDDEHAIVSSMAYYFSKKGYDVKGINSPEDALIELAQGDYDVVITDLYMEPINGFEVAEVAKKTLPKALLIAMSGKYRKDEVTQLKADCFFEKPFLYKDVEECIKGKLAASGNV